MKISIHISSEYSEEGFHLGLDQALQALTFIFAIGRCTQPVGEHRTCGRRAVALTPTFNDPSRPPVGVNLTCAMHLRKEFDHYVPPFYGESEKEA